MMAQRILLCLTISLVVLTGADDVDPATPYLNKAFSVLSNGRPGEVVFLGSSADGYTGSKITMDDRRMGPNPMNGMAMDNSWAILTTETLTNVKFFTLLGATHVTFVRPLASETYFGILSEGKEVTNHWNSYTIHGHYLQGASRIAWPFDGHYVNTYGGKYYQTPSWGPSFTEISDCCISWTRSPPEFTILAHSRRGTLVMDGNYFKIRWEGGVWEDLPTAYVWWRYDNAIYIQFTYTHCDNCATLACTKETYYGLFSWGGSSTHVSGHFIKDGEEFPYAWEGSRVVGYTDLDSANSPAASVGDDPMTFSVLHNGYAGSLTINSTQATLTLDGYPLPSHIPNTPGSYPLNSLVWSELSATSTYNYRPFYYVTFQRTVGTYVYEYHGLYNDLRGTIDGYYYVDIPTGHGSDVYKFQGYPFNAVLQVS